MMDGVHHDVGATSDDTQAICSLNEVASRCTNMMMHAMTCMHSVTKSSAM